MKKVLTITLHRKKVKRGWKFKWIGSDGYDYSPMFDNQHEAEDFPVNCGLSALRNDKSAVDRKQTLF